VVANSLFITGTKTNAGLDQETGKKERTRQQRKQTDGIKSRVKSYTQTVKTRENLDNGIKPMGYKSCQELHANRQDKENLGNGIKWMGYKSCQESHASCQD
jgi:hypothetical protein